MGTGWGTPPAERVEWQIAVAEGERMTTTSRRDHDGTDPAPSRPMIGLVLGAGGVVGQAYHAGVLAALEGAAGWDPRAAELVVGSSAGSITGTLLRLGVTAADLLATAIGTSLSASGAATIEELFPAGAAVQASGPASWVRPWRPPSAALVARVARRPWAFRPDVAVSTLLPRGTVDLTDRAAPLERKVGASWPTGLWICAVRRTDGARVVFGRPGAPRASLAAAVLASCAIPAYFAPVEIGGVEYFDGGVHSPTNADVVRSRLLDAAVVVAPMSSRRPHPATPDALLRWSAHRRLDHEVRRLARVGIPVIRCEPGPESLEAMGLRPMADDRSDRVAEAAYRETLRSPAARALAGFVATSSAGGAPAVGGAATGGRAG